MTKLAPALDAALTYAGHGLAVFPLAPRSKVPPKGSRGFKDATKDGGILTRRFGAVGDDANVAIATGNGLIVVDLDGPEAEAWALGHDWPETWTVETGRGRHIYLLVDRPISTRPSLAPKVDVKGEGGYVMAPPSVHPGGTAYIFAHGGPGKGAIAAAPAWLLALLDEPRQPERPAPAAVDDIVTVGQDDFGARRAASLAKQGFSRTEAKAALEQMIGTRFAGGWAGLDPSRPWKHEDVDRWLEGAYQKYYDPGAPARAAADERLEARVHAKGPVAAAPGRPARRAEPVAPAAALDVDDIIGVSASDIDAKAVRWNWKGRLPAGMLVILDGDPGLGKSTIIADWIARVTTGTPWPTGEACELGGAIYVGAEDPAAEVVIPRLRAAGADLRRVRIVTTVPTRDGKERMPILPADLDIFARAIQALNARLLVFDPVISYVAAELSSYSDKDVRQALTPLADMLAGTACTGLMLRHLRKDDKASAAMYRGGGSIAFVAVARAGFAVSKVKGADGATALMATKANLAPKPKSLRYGLEQVVLPGGIETSRVTWGAETDDDPDESMTAFGTGDGKPREKAELLIQEFLGEGPRPSADLDAAALDAGISRRTLFRARDELDVKARRVGADAWWVALPEHEDLLQHVTEVRQGRVPNPPFAAPAAAPAGGTMPEAPMSKFGTLYSNGSETLALYPSGEEKSATVPPGNIRVRAREDEPAACQHDGGEIVRRGRRLCALCGKPLELSPAA